MRCLAHDNTQGGSPVSTEYFAQGAIIGGTPYYYVQDQLGSVTELVSATGAITSQFAYDPYGNKTIVSGTVKSDIGYAGYFSHAASGLDFTIYRAYDPTHARWLNRDPIAEAGGVNLYAYVGGDPQSLIDPLGLCPAAPTTAECFITGIAAGAATAIVLGAVATVAAPIVGATAVTVGLSAIAVAGGFSLGGIAAHDIRNHNWAGVAYDAGSVVGGLATGIAGGPGVARAIDPNATPGWSPQSWRAQAYKSDEGSWGDWFKSGPTQASAGLSTGAAGWLSSLFGAGCH